MNKNKQIRIINLSLIISMLLLSACQTQQTSTTAAASEIVIPITTGTINSTITTIGYVQYNQSADLTWRTSGVIEDVNVKVGDKVSKGQVLADLEVSSLSSSVILAEKDVVDAQENLEDVQSSSTEKMNAYAALNEKETALKEAKLAQEALYYPRADQQTLEWAYDDYALANLNFNYAKQDYDRMVENNESWDVGSTPYQVEKFSGSSSSGRGGFGGFGGFGGASSGGGYVYTETVDEDKYVSARERVFESYVSNYENLVEAFETFTWENGVPTDTEFAVAEGNVQVAQMEYDKALEEYLSYGSGPREKDIVAAEISLTSAENNYNKRNVLASFDGTVTSVTAEAGFYVKNGDAAFRIDDTSRMFVPVDVSEIDVSHIYNGQKATIKLDALSDKAYSGKVYKVDESGTNNDSTTSFNAWVEFDDPDDSIKAGMTAEVGLVLDEKTDALLVPNSALSSENETTYVTVSASPENKKVAVTLGMTSDNISEVMPSAEIAEGTQIVVSSITETVLQELGLDPMQYLRPAGMNMQGGQMPEGMPQGQMPAGMPEQGQMPEAMPEQMPASEAAPVNEPAVQSTEVSEETQVEEAADTSAANADTGRPQMPEGMDQGQMPPEGGMPPMGADGERPERPADGQRPENGQMPGNGAAAQSTENTDAAVTE